MTLEVTIGVSSRAKPGEIACGDQVGVVKDHERSLVVVADGVGHGREAAEAARAAIASAMREPWAPLDEIMSRCHREIVSTRGVALTMVRVHAGRGDAEHIAIGNVDVVASTRDKVRWLAVPGIVGSRVRKLVVSQHRLYAGDILVIHTDGVSRHLDIGSCLAFDAPSLASKLLETYASLHDDAACVVIRC